MMRRAQADGSRGRGAKAGERLKAIDLGAGWRMLGRTPWIGWMIGPGSLWAPFGRLNSRFRTYRAHI